MSVDSPSIDVLLEMVKNIKEESFPRLHADVNRINGSIAKALTDIDDLKKFKNQHEGELRGMRWLGGVILSIISVFIAYLTFRKTG